MPRPRGWAGGGAEWWCCHEHRTAVSADLAARAYAVRSALLGRTLVALVLVVDVRTMSTIPGLRARTTERGIRIIELDYFADPARGPAWLEEARKRSTSLAEFQRNVLRNWHISGGTGVYAEFTEIGREQYVYEPPSLLKLPVYRGWDLGRRHPACVWLQYAPKSDRVYVLREFEPKDIAAHHFRDACRYFSGQLARTALDTDTLEWVQMQEALPGMPKPPWFPPDTVFIDLAGNEATMRQSIASRDPREATLRQVWAAGGIEFGIQIGPVKARVDVLRRLLYLRADGRPGILISPYCPAVLAMLDGGLTYKKATPVRMVQEEVRKDGQSDDVHDALTYALVGIVPAEGVPGVTPGMAPWPTEDEDLGWTL